MSQLKITVENALAIVSLNNPPQNRFGLEMLGEFENMFETVARKGARALLVRSETQDFSFGGDIRPWPEMSHDELRWMFERYLTAFNRFERLSIPTVAAVRGICFGGGFELTQRCDIVFAATSARFGHPEQTLGLTTLIGGVQRVAERAGRNFAAELAYSFEPYTAEVMHQRGLVNRVVADEVLEEQALDMAKRLASGPTRAIAANKALLRLWSQGGVEAADAALVDLSMPVVESEDAKQGLKSALDAMAKGIKRPTLVFEGR